VTKKKGFLIWKAGLAGVLLIIIGCITYACRRRSDDGHPRDQELKMNEGR